LSYFGKTIDNLLPDARYICIDFTFTTLRAATGPIEQMLRTSGNGTEATSKLQHTITTLKAALRFFPLGMSTT
jgi:hypothetical protein